MGLKVFNTLASGANVEPTTIENRAYLTKSQKRNLQRKAQRQSGVKVPVTVYKYKPVEVVKEVTVEKIVTVEKPVIMEEIHYYKYDNDDEYETTYETRKVTKFHNMPFKASKRYQDIKAAQQKINCEIEHQQQKLQELRNERSFLEKLIGEKKTKFENEKIKTQAALSQKKDAVRSMQNKSVELKRAKKETRILEHKNRVLQSKLAAQKKKSENLKSVLSGSKKSTITKNPHNRESKMSLRRSRIDVYNFNRGAYTALSSLSVANFGIRAFSAIAIYRAWCKAELFNPDARNLRSQFRDFDLFAFFKKMEERPILAYVVYAYGWYNINVRKCPLYMTFHQFLINSARSRNHLFNNFNNYDLSYEWSQFYDSNEMVIIEQLTAKFGDCIITIPGRILARELFVEKLKNMLDWRILLEFIPFGNLVYRLVSCGLDTYQAFYDLVQSQNIQNEFACMRLISHEMSVPKIEHYIKPDLGLANNLVPSARLFNSRKPYTNLQKIAEREARIANFHEEVFQKGSELVSVGDLHSVHDVINRVSSTAQELGISHVSAGIYLGECMDLIVACKSGTCDDWNFGWNCDLFWDFVEAYWFNAHWKCKFCGEVVACAKGPARTVLQNSHARECAKDWNDECIKILEKFVEGLLTGAKEKGLTKGKLLESPTLDSTPSSSTLLTPPIRDDFTYGLHERGNVIGRHHQNTKIVDDEGNEYSHDEY